MSSPIDDPLTLAGVFPGRAAVVKPEKLSDRRKRNTAIVAQTGNQRLLEMKAKLAEKKCVRKLASLLLVAYLFHAYISITGRD